MKTRIGNIEFRLAKRDGSNQQYVEIVCWSPATINGKEICYTIATIEIEKHPDVKSISLRAFQLDEQDDKDFKKLVIYAYQYATKLWDFGDIK